MNPYVEGQENNRRKMTMESWINNRWSNERITWDELWMNMTHLVGMRSPCSRDRIGAVVVTPDNQLLSCGYNGPPPNSPLPDTWCSEWCPRAMSNGNDQWCYSAHSEFNAIIRAPRDLRQGGILYVNSAVCIDCAKLIPSSGIGRVIMKVTREHAHRDPDTSIALLQECGIDVVVWAEHHTVYSRIFVDANGMGPHTCYFCDGTMARIEAIHHINHDHSDNSVDNLAAAHTGCHSRYHMSGISLTRQTSSRASVTWNRRKPVLECPTCGLNTTPGWLKRHCEYQDHDMSAYHEWKEQSEREQRTCVECGVEFDTYELWRSHRRSWNIAGGCGLRRCVECDKESSNAGVANHQIATGHSGVELVPVDQHNVIKLS